MAPSPGHWPNPGEEFTSWEAVANATSSSPPPKSDASLSSLEIDHAVPEKPKWSARHDVLLLQELVAQVSSPDCLSVDWENIARMLTLEAGSEYKAVPEGLVRSKAHTLKAKLSAILKTPSKHIATNAIPSPQLTRPLINNQTNSRGPPSAITPPANQKRGVAKYTNTSLTAKSAALTKLDNLATNLKTKQDARDAVKLEEARAAKRVKELRDEYEARQPRRPETAEDAVRMFQQRRQLEAVSSSFSPDLQQNMPNSSDPLIKAETKSPPPDLHQNADAQYLANQDSLYIHLRGTQLRIDEHKAQQVAREESRKLQSISSKEIYEAGIRDRSRSGSGGRVIKVMRYDIDESGNSNSVVGVGPRGGTGQRGVRTGLMQGVGCRKAVDGRTQNAAANESKSRRTTEGAAKTVGKSKGSFGRSVTLTQMPNGVRRQ